jgi:CRP/FNR family transcriptional regulator, cyclic AMP receptor protein
MGDVVRPSFWHGICWDAPQSQRANMQTVDSLAVSALERQHTDRQPALFLAETIGELGNGSRFLEQLSPQVWNAVRHKACAVTFEKGENVFIQGDPHTGIWLIEDGVVRTFYAAPSGRQITLAYWTAGNFVGGPDIFGGGEHVWSADAAQNSRLLYLPAAAIRGLIQRHPSFALCIIEGLSAKGKCYSALVQMLGTRSIIERLTQLLTILAENYGRRDRNRVIIERKLTHDEIATIVGSTRQWVTITLDRLQKRGIISIARQTIVVERYDLLLAAADCA